MLASIAETHSVPDAAPPAEIAAVYAANADFVWASLQRLGVADADLPDAFQEVFVIAHRRLNSFEHRSAMSTWLFGISVRVVAAHRRRAHVRRERLVERVPEGPAPATEDPEAVAIRREDQQRLRELLDQLDPEKRATFVMYEIDELPCEQIAAITGVPVGTVHSRLFAARKLLTQAAARGSARHDRRER